MKKKLPNKLPKYLYRYFWDVNPVKLNPSKKSIYIAERLMDRGDIKAFKWLKQYFSNKDLKKVYIKSRNISKFSRPFWAAYLKAFTIDQICSQEEFLQPHDAAWPY